ncbi:platelet-derived growth factor subunit B-like isoform X3 [Narcine bancroftii]|uniref:platelet-derived growth factor subunit B-like isoform X3 n=1 Tax=Narcine bancroftii TaxID=1343680 RepID=UPI003831B5EF
MNLGIALLALWHLWPETEGDWIAPQLRHQSFLLHPTLGKSLTNGSIHGTTDGDGMDFEDPGSFSVNEGDHKRAPRVTRSSVVELAKRADCKVRPEVMEITRSMVDPTRANFYLWPSCVEVQRCSGCCNTRTYKCQATKVQERRVQDPHPLQLPPWSGPESTAAANESIGSSSISPGRKGFTKDRNTKPREIEVKSSPPGPGKEAWAEMQRGKTGGE